jgi:hypothetical protein
MAQTQVIEKIGKEITKMLVKKLIEEERIVFTRDDVEGVIIEALEGRRIGDIERIADNVFDELNVELLADDDEEVYVLLPREDIFDSAEAWRVLRATYTALEEHVAPKRIREIIGDTVVCAAYENYTRERCNLNEAWEWYLGELELAYGVEAQ